MSYAMYPDQISIGYGWVKQLPPNAKYTKTVAKDNFITQIDLNGHSTIYTVSEFSKMNDQFIKKLAKIHKVKVNNITKSKISGITFYHYPINNSTTIFSSLGQRIVINTKNKKIVQRLLYDLRKSK